jgi:Nif-specific regulatory protein
MFDSAIDPHKFELLIEVFNMMSTNSGDLSVLFENIVSSAMRLIGSEAASLLLVDQKKRTLFFEVALGSKGEDVKKFTLPMDEGIAGWVVTNRKSLIVHDVEGDPRFFDQISKAVGFTTKSILATPLIIKDEIIGVLEIINKNDGHYFDDDDRLWLEIFSTQAAIAYHNAQAWKTVKDELDSLKQKTDNPFKNMVYKSRSMDQVMNLVHRYAPTDSTVLITGESGVGKELIAEQIHIHSTHKSGPFVRINCAAIPENLLEAELFGARKGAYTDAAQDRVGKMESANEGTLFLDEIGTLSLAIQAKLLRVLQSRVINPLGTNENIPLTARIIAATNLDLKSAVERGEFRKDLFFRLNVLPIRVPALRDRAEDILLLADFFLKKNAKKLKKTLSFHPQTMETMLSYHWTGNVRELENTIERACILSEDAELLPEHLHIETEGKLNSPQEQDFELKSALNSFKTRHLIKILEMTGGNQTKAAKVLGIQRTYLSRLLKELDIETSHKEH